jgi:hypothetical protein
VLLLLARLLGGVGMLDGDCEGEVDGMREACLS